ncbi:Uncharacterized protein APZ42_002460 [Daphnia magna]|uniref:Uncharacterized protein n=1 Tax=Daphnia magna TaxID=35525 RepID=A0A162C535_9CRUS|nr:Uncharacterized protein APZ42_002460 [Daphnia magna]
MITFTDSRQGTARMAATLQRDSERNSLRSAVYRSLAAVQTPTNNIAPDLLQQIRMLKAMNNPQLATTIELLEQQVAAESAPKVITFEALAKQLAMHDMDIWRWALSYYREINPVQFEAWQQPGDAGPCLGAVSQARSCERSAGPGAQSYPDERGGVAAAAQAHARLRGARDVLSGIQ